MSYFDDLPDEMLQEIIQFLNRAEYLAFCSSIQRILENPVKFKHMITEYIVEYLVDFTCCQYKEIYNILPNGKKNGIYKKYQDINRIPYLWSTYSPLMYDRTWKLVSEKYYSNDDIIESINIKEDQVKCTIEWFKPNISGIVTIMDKYDYLIQGSKYEYKKEKTIEIKDGDKYETCRRWWSEGQIRSVSYYKNESPIGIWEDYDITGKLICKENYDI